MWLSTEQGTGMLFKFFTDHYIFVPGCTYVFTMGNIQEGHQQLQVSLNHCSQVFSLDSDSPFRSLYVHLTSVREAYSCVTTVLQKVAPLSPVLFNADVSLIMK